MPTPRIIIVYLFLGGAVLFVDEYCGADGDGGGEVWG